MKNIDGCTDLQRKILLRLHEFVEKDKLNVADVWNCFSAPKKKATLRTKADRTCKVERDFSADDVDALSALKTTVWRILDERSCLRCEYCRRPRGQHSYSWHMEHIVDKSKDSTLMFEMSNLAASCVECNFTKNKIGKESENRPLINPTKSDFIYSSHLSMLQLSTECLHFVKYKPLDRAEGLNTYDLLKFGQLEKNTLLGSASTPTGRWFRHVAARIEELQACKGVESDALIDLVMTLRDRAID